MQQRAPSPDAVNPDGAARGGIRGGRRWAFRLAAVFIVPALFLGLIEISLRLVGYGYPTAFFVKSGDRDVWTTNERFGWRFFPRAIARAPVDYVSFPTRKPAGTYRIFLFGESAAMGEPVADFNFGRILEVMLRERYPEMRFEVINAAMTAINSHVVREIAGDCAKHDADLFLVYMGNNEVVGPFGPGTIFMANATSLPLIRASIWARCTKVGELIGDLSQHLSRDRVRVWGGMEMFVNNLVAAGDRRLEVMYGHFRKNLADICKVARESGAQVMLCTPACNLKDCAPFASMHRPDLGPTMRAEWTRIYNAGIALESGREFDKAVERYTEALSTDDQFADLHFRLAGCHLALGRQREAFEHYVRARDLDALRFRADTGINRVIRETAASLEGQGIHLVDTELAFQENAPLGIPGRELFWDHVHMNFDGNYLLARTVFQKVAKILPKPADRISEEVPPPSMERCADVLALTGWDVEGISRYFVQNMIRPPFAFQLDHAERYELLLQLQRDLSKRYTTPEALREASEVYRKALSNRPGDFVIRRRFGSLLYLLGDYAGAIEQFNLCLQDAPYFARVHSELEYALAAKGKMDRH